MINSIKMMQKLKNNEKQLREYGKEKIERKKT